MKKLFIWLAGFAEDQKGSASSKRFTLYTFLYFFFMQVKASVNGTLGSEEINKYILYGTVVVILFLIGAITTEFVKSALLKSREDDGGGVPPAPNPV